ncbi:hypothetical protein QG516_16695 [Pedobacter gandavensis]|uniref:hypothetical protein n=1 Tax=Pedobacter TaxID=84567 RepID=UPI001C9A248A|nr:MULTISPECIES: hypothetical protein [Pedobacter]WGQ12619.1 hypothetical protein QG516_16695 [Pedobacter gandavensis]
MEVAISTGLFAKWNMDVNTGHPTKVRYKKKISFFQSDEIGDGPISELKRP